MTFILETGAGTPGATSYSDVAFALAYLTDLGRETENLWSTLAGGDDERKELLIEGTQYIDRVYGGCVGGNRLRQKIDGRLAEVYLTMTVLPVEDETVTIGLKTYRFRDTLLAENDVLIGADINASMDNLQLAIAGDVGDVTLVHSKTVQNYEVASGVQPDDTLLVVAQAKGTSANLIVSTETLTNGSFGSATLLGGLDEGPQPLIFPRTGLVGWDLKVVTSIPLKVKQAAVEYAVRAASTTTTLAPDLDADSTGGTVQRKREKVGPLEEETQFAEGGGVRIWKRFPWADALLVEFCPDGLGGRRVFR